jgi:transposase
LRHGLVWDNSAWTAAHEAWLRAQRFDRVGVQPAFDEAFDAMLTVHARRDRLDAAITQMVAAGRSPRWWAGWVACAGSAH